MGRACDGKDRYLHMRLKCLFYQTKSKDIGKPELDDKERVRRWKTPLILVTGNYTATASKGNFPEESDH